MFQTACLFNCEQLLNNSQDRAVTPPQAIRAGSKHTVVELPFMKPNCCRILSHRSFATRFFLSELVGNEIRKYEFQFLGEPRL